MIELAEDPGEMRYRIPKALPKLETAHGNGPGMSEQQSLPDHADDAAETTEQVSFHTACCFAEHPAHDAGNDYL